MPAKTRWRTDRPRRQPRRLGRAAAADRPHAPAARAHGGDRPSDRRRCQIWRAGGVPDRRDQPQAASPRAADPDRRAGRRQDRRHRRAAGPFRGEPRDAGLRVRWRAIACRSSKPAPLAPRRSSARSRLRPRRGGASAGRAAVARLASRRRSGGEPAGDFRLRRDARRQRRDDLCARSSERSQQHGLELPPPRGQPPSDRPQPDRSHGGASARRIAPSSTSRWPRITSAHSGSCALRARSRSRCSTAFSSCSTRSRRTAGCSRSRRASRTAG